VKGSASGKGGVWKKKEGVSGRNKMMLGESLGILQLALAPFSPFRV